MKFSSTHISYKRNSGILRNGESQLIQRRHTQTFRIQMYIVLHSNTMMLKLYCALPVRAV